MTQLDFNLNVTSEVPAVPLPSAESLEHPYARYGLAVALAFHTKSRLMSELTEAELREALARALESGLNSFRMETLDNPQHEEQLRFRAIPLDTLRSDPSLVSGKLAAQGKYLFPSIIASDVQVGGTFGDAEKVLADLRNDNIPLDIMLKLKRSIAPVAGEINNGKPNKENIKGTLFEAACTAIATVASEKASAKMKGSKKIGGSNTGIFPDLDIAQLIEFVRVFYLFQKEGNNRLVGKRAKGQKYNPPPIYDGNYPNAPRDDAFGAVGLLAAMGYWASRADETTRKETLAVLDALKDKPFYLVSYDGVSQAAFQHHVVDLAKTGSLQTILSDFYREARPYSVYEEAYLRTDLPLVRHFYFAASRFLQRFDAPAFRDFLATRAEYPPSFDLLFKTYFKPQLENHFMQEAQASDLSLIVDSARSLGQWMNYTAYRVADAEVAPHTKEEKAKLSKEERGKRNQSVRKVKAKNLVQFESYILSAKTPSDMLFRINRTTSLLSEQDAPDAARPFMDATATKRLPLKEAQQLLLAYLRLRTAETSEPITGGAPTDDDSDLAEKETE